MLQLYTHYLCVWVTGLDEGSQHRPDRVTADLLLQINWALALQYSQKGCTGQRAEGAAVSMSSNALHCRGGVQQGLVGGGQTVLVTAAESILCCAAPKQIFEPVDSILGQQRTLDNISMSLPALLPMKNWHWNNHEGRVTQKLLGLGHLSLVTTLHPPPFCNRGDRHPYLPGTHHSSKVRSVKGKKLLILSWNETYN